MATKWRVAVRGLAGTLVASTLLAPMAVGCGGGTEPGGQEDLKNLRIRNGDVTLVGTLDLPAGAGPFPVMVFIPGSGRTTRADDRAAVDLAVPQGIAVFRYDKRGLGQSSGTFEEVTTENSERVIGVRASDVAAIVNYLATRADIRPNQIFLWGTSQGGWVAPLVANQTGKVAFIIGVSGGGSPVGTEIYYQQQASANPSKSVEEVTALLNGFPGPYGYDPAPALRAMTVPALWVFGGQDRNNPSLYDIARLEQIVQENSRDFTIKLFPRMNHDMIDVDTGTFPATLFPMVFAFVAPRLGL